ncbi:MAG: septum formation initiator family protein [Oscillospiraceae bacterium]|nr:septum formation initiator family protein [Oscillospiraceae bacterium]
MAVKKSKVNHIFNVAIAALVIYLAATFLTLQVDLASYRKQLASLEAEKQEQILVNGEMRALLEQGTDEDYIIRMARDKLGLIFPDEQVFYNASGNQ